MRKVKIVPSCRKEEIRMILNEYLIELSKFDSYIKFDKFKTPIYKYYDLYFKEKNRYPFCLCVDNEIAGIALVREIENLSYEIGEFYVKPEFRNDGNALFFANELISLFSGSISYSTKLTNSRAIKFWDKIAVNFENKLVSEDEEEKHWCVFNNSIKNHVMGLQKEYYNRVYCKEKIYEARLNDEKRKKIKIGDIITFSMDPDRKESFNVLVINKFVFSSFKEMVDKLELKKLGFVNKKRNEVASIYHSFYPVDQENKYGVVVFEVRVI